MDMESPEQLLDVVIIGGGPAGSAAGTWLHRQGYRTLILEKDHHPRFHIGESLLPLSLPYLESLGVIEDIESIGLRKYAAEFHSPYHGRNIAFFFRDALRADYPYAYEVRRSEFDEILFRNAEKSGASVLEGMTVDQALLSDGRIESLSAIDNKGCRHTFKARFFIDASGRDTFLASVLGTKERDPKHRSAALYAHYEGALRSSGEDEGNIAIYWFDHGWFWMIPLKDGIMSVGAVCKPEYFKSREGSLENFFDATIELAPGVQTRLEPSTRVTPVTATGNYSYRSTKMTGPNFLMVGDSYAFIDPVFSSGVHLALAGADAAAKTVSTILQNPDDWEAPLKRYESDVKKGLGRFAWFIYRITHPVIRDLFMNPRTELNLRGGVISLLAGDIFRSTRIGLPLGIFRGIFAIKCLLIRLGLIKIITP